jgi:hypothetical protein
MLMPSPHFEPRDLNARIWMADLFSGMLAIGMMGQDFTPKQYFNHCAIISGQILTGSCWDDTPQNLASNCLFGSVLTALVLLNDS